MPRGGAPDLFRLNDQDPTPRRRLRDFSVARSPWPNCRGTPRQLCAPPQCGLGECAGLCPARGGGGLASGGRGGRFLASRPTSWGKGTNRAIPKCVAFGAVRKRRRSRRPSADSQVQSWSRSRSRSGLRASTKRQEVRHHVLEYWRLDSRPRRTAACSAVRLSRGSERIRIAPPCRPRPQELKALFEPPDRSASTQAAAPAAPPPPPAARPDRDIVVADGCAPEGRPCICVCSVWWARFHELLSNAAWLVAGRFIDARSSSGRRWTE